MQAADIGGAVVKLWYVNLFVSDFERALGFYEETLGFAPETKDSQFGYASFATADVRFAIVLSGDSELVGRHTGIGFGVEDLAAAHRDLAARGVEFTMPPERQPWGGFMAMFRDPDGNSFYLDQLDDRHSGH